MPELEEYIRYLSRLGGVLQMAPSDRSLIDRIAEVFARMEKVDRESLAQFVQKNPDAVPILGLSVGLSQEQLKNILRMELQTSSWKKLAKERPSDLVRVLDENFDLVERLKLDRSRKFKYSDVLAERFSSRLRAGGAIGRGRSLEDAVETIVGGLGLPMEMRTRFEGRSGMTAPADMAIPAGGAAAKIVVAIKGFDSTGSKLTDAAREVKEMASVRRADQFVFVVADGMGWLSRQADLRRILALATDGSISGVFTKRTLDDLMVSLTKAARIHGMLEE